MKEPPPIPRKKTGLPWPVILLVAVFVPAFVVCVILVAAGLLRSYSVPSDGMKPAISRGDRVLMEGVTYLLRPPRPGEIVAYRSDGLEAQEPGLLYVRRIAGRPGDSLRIADGKLSVNDKHLALSNLQGEIAYFNPPNARFLSSATETVVVPEGHYFVLGDNSAHSLDSRFFGFVPAKNIKGRIMMRR